MENLPTKNELRTADYLARLADRRTDLQARLAKIAGDRPRFTWEVGCGHGHFLTAYAAAHPNELCIGIDLVADRIARAERKRQRAGLSNLFFIQAEANLFLGVLPSESALSTVFILFPDPWPKSRHHKHRILQPQFLSAAAAHANHDCRLCFRTDFRPYFEDTASLLQNHPAWEAADAPWPFEYETVFQSRAPTFHSLVARRRINAQQP